MPPKNALTAAAVVLATSLAACGGTSGQQSSGTSKGSGGVTLHGRIVTTSITSANELPLWRTDCGQVGLTAQIANGAGAILRVATGAEKTLSVKAVNADGTREYAPQTMVCETDYSATVPTSAVYVISIQGVTASSTGNPMVGGTLSVTLNSDQIVGGAVPDLTENVYLT